MSRSGVATALAELGEREKALQILQVGRAMIARLKERSPDNARLAKDLPCFDVQIAEASKTSREIPSWHCRSYTPSPTADRMAIANPRLHLALHSAKVPIIDRGTAA